MLTKMGNFSLVIILFLNPSCYFSQTNNSLNECNILREVIIYETLNNKDNKVFFAKKTDNWTEIDEVNFSLNYYLKSNNQDSINLLNLHIKNDERISLKKCLISKERIKQRISFRKRNKEYFILSNPILINKDLAIIQQRYVRRPFSGSISLYYFDLINMKVIKRSNIIVS